MKKIFLFAGALAALASCNNDETVEYNQVKDEVRFTAHVEGTTRAEGDAAAPTSRLFKPGNAPTRFIVNAVAAEGEGTAQFIKGDTYDTNTNKWTSGATYYWPKGEVTFKTFVGFDEGTAVTVADPKTQADLVYAAQKKAKADLDAHNTVNLNFRHALAQVMVNAKNTDNTLQVTVSKTEIVNFKNAGTYALSGDATDGIVTTSWVGTGRGTWTLSGEATQSYAEAKSVAVGTDAEALTSDELLFMPNSGLSAWAKTDANTKKGSYIQLTAVIKQKVGQGDAVTIHNGKVLIPVALNWVEGKKYNYTIVFGKGEGGIDPENPDKPIFVNIKLTATVDDFAAENTEKNANQ